MTNNDSSADVEFKDWKPRLSPLALAELIVDAMIDAGVVAKNAFEHAVGIAVVELASSTKRLTASALATSLVQALVLSHLVLPSDIESGCAITIEELDVRRSLESY